MNEGNTETGSLTLAALKKKKTKKGAVVPGKEEAETTGNEELKALEAHMLRLSRQGQFGLSHGEKGPGIRDSDCVVCVVTVLYVITQGVEHVGDSVCVVCYNLGGGHVGDSVCVVCYNPGGGHVGDSVCVVCYNPGENMLVTRSVLYVITQGENMLVTRSVLYVITWG